MTTDHIKINRWELCICFMGLSPIVISFASTLNYTTLISFTSMEDTDRAIKSSFFSILSNSVSSILLTDLKMSTATGIQGVNIDLKSVFVGKWLKYSQNEVSLCWSAPVCVAGETRNYCYNIRYQIVIKIWIKLI